jgi:CRP-like cAMP-binding protein
MGDPGDELYILRGGGVALFTPPKEEAKDERPIRILEAGEILGEMALIDDAPRSLSARALEETEVVVLTGEAFRQLLRRYPEAAFAVMSGLNERIRYTTQFLMEVRSWVRRVAEGQYDRGFEPDGSYADRSIAALAADFAQMAARVRQREEELRRQVDQLRIRIDESKKERQVEEITGSDYFQNLKSKAKKLREKRGE